jgi:phosphatidyl-myo-inositol dimannoside synthase
MNEKRQKTLLVTYDYPPLTSGIGSCFHQLWRILPPAEHLILAPRVKGWRATDHNYPIRVIRYLSLLPFSVCRVLILPFYIIFLKLTQDINLIICGVPLSLGFLGWLFKKLFAIPYGVFYYGGEFAKYQRTPFFRLLKKIFAEASFIITNSDYTSEEAGRFGLAGQKIVKLTLGIDSEVFSPRGDFHQLRDRLGLSGQKVLLTVARLVKRKGVDAVLLALPQVLASVPNCQYLIVGEGEEEKSLRRQVGELQLEKNVIFCGAVKDNTKVQYYNLCDVYVMPNRETTGKEILEGFGLSFIEASACGKPVIGGISGGVRDAVVDGVTGLLIDPSDSERLAAGIIRLLKDENYARQLGQNGQRRVIESFQWPERAEILQQLIQTSVKEKTES